VFLLFLLIAVFPPTAPATQPTFQPANFHKTVTKELSLNYLVQLPPAYADHPHEKLPLLIFLHGSGECGADPNELNKVAKLGPMKDLPNLPQFHFVVVAPQCPSEVEWWQYDALDAMLDDVLAKYDVDPDRVYLTGLSMGGCGVWEWAVRRPERFAAIAPVSGEPNTDLADILAKAKLPIWAFHGAKDKEVWSHEDEKMIALITKAGGDAKLTLYPDVGHGDWSRTYGNPELYEWFLKHTRREPQRKRGAAH
jgi:predicted peptidase